MKCSKHPNYPGHLQPSGKRNHDCKECWALYEATCSKTKGYMSLTTPEFLCDLAHILTEVGVLMMYGRQSPYFWRKNSEAREEVKKYFGQKYTFISKKIKTDPGYFVNIRELFGIIYFVEAKKRAAKIIKEEMTEVEPGQTNTIENTQDINDVLKNLTENDSGSRKMSKWEAWKDIGGTNSGESEEN